MNMAQNVDDIYGELIKSDRILRSCIRGEPAEERYLLVLCNGTYHVFDTETSCILKVLLNNPLIILEAVRSGHCKSLSDYWKEP